jgi:monovalent cation/proton antiporter MnhG/PhaG subunit
VAVTVFQDFVTYVLLGSAVLLVLASSLGVLLMRDVFQKMHYVTPAGIVAPLLVALAVTVQQGWSEATTETWLALLFVAATGPVLAHATARAARIREHGDWRQADDPLDTSAGPKSP